MKLRSAGDSAQGLSSAARSEFLSAPDPRRIVVYTADLSSHAVARGIAEIDDALPGLEWLVVVHAPKKPLPVLLRNQRLNLKRNGWRWIPYQFNDALQRLRSPGSPRRHRSSIAAALSARPNVRVEHVADIHAESTLARVRAFGADLGLSLAAPILRRSLFALPRLGTLNLHKGRLPDYRGMPPAFWELWNDEASVGCSVHWVDDKLDTGAVVARTDVPRATYATLRGLQLRLDEVGIELMGSAVAAVLDGRATAELQPAGSGRTYRKPTLQQAAALAGKLDRLQPAAGTAVQRYAKDRALGLGFQFARRAAPRLAAPRITVLLYHRVSDDARDNLTVGVEQFDRQMRLVAEHCDVLSIEEVLATETVRRSKRPVVAITFDDGYRDNFLHAAPILRRHDLPAAFFVSTGIIDRRDRFPHDIARGNAAIPLLGWDDLRAMRRWGYTIGSHTANHIDCASEPEDRVRAELAESRDRLRAELGVTEPIFAYPYGGREHMTPQRLELVREAGYVGCLAAYGGTNIGRVDRYNVLRRGIQWAFSDNAFLFECLGLR
ncbi:MAG: polysaccharide deacetylase family protein [Proteobacteria bacterium]|nr:polysaccharide deacetylase family protein [Pseudomonadota bacterium]